MLVNYKNNTNRTLTDCGGHLSEIMRTNVSVSRKRRTLRSTGQTHPYIHRLKRALTLTATIKSVLSAQALALWPRCWRSVGNDAVSSRNKTGRRISLGQSRLQTKSHGVKQPPDLTSALPSALSLPCLRYRSTPAVKLNPSQSCDGFVSWCFLVVTATPCGISACSSGGAVTCREPPHTRTQGSLA